MPVEKSGKNLIRKQVMDEIHKASLETKHTVRNTVLDITDSSRVFQLSQFITTKTAYFINKIYPLAGSFSCSVLSQPAVKGLNVFTARARYSPRAGDILFDQERYSPGPGAIWPKALSNNFSSS